MHGEERQVEPDQLDPELPDPQTPGEHPSRHLREPIEHRRHHAEERAAEQHVVQVGDDPISVVDREVHRGRRRPDAVDPSDQEHRDEAEREQHGGFEAELPAPERGQPDEEQHARRDRDQLGRHAEERQLDGSGREHVMRPHAEGQRRDQQEREDHAPIAEDRLAREDRDDLGDDAPRSEDQHVHLRVAEEPEDVLPQDDDASSVRVEEARTELTVREHHDQCGREDGRREEHEERRREDAPREHGHPHHRHARCAHPQDRHDEVDRAQDRGGAYEHEAHDPQVLSRPELFRQRRVAGPPGCGRSAVGEESRQDRQAAGGEQPEGQGVDPGERHVEGADLQRHEEVPEPREQREDHEEDHQRPVQREELVVGVRGEDLRPRPGELGPHQQREDPCHGEEREAVDQVEQSDLLVIGRGQPVEEPAAFGLRREGRGRCLFHRHVVSSMLIRCLIPAPRRTIPTWRARGRRTGSSSGREASHRRAGSRSPGRSTSAT